MRSTFSGFTAAQLSMRASQRALDVTGQNIANINTQGYTRQRLDQYSLSMGSFNRYATQDAFIGYGVGIKGVSQIRDPYLDSRFRSEMAKVGESDTWLAGLNDLESIFDEVAKTGLESGIQDFSSMLQKLSTQVGNKEFDGMVKTSAENLTKLFNQYAKQVQGVRENAEDELKTQDIPNINNILKTITELNKTIKHNEIYGNQALELRDQRNELIDELSSYMNIDVKYTPKKIGDSVTLEEMSIDLIGNDGTRFSLVNDDKHGEFAVNPSTADSSKLLLSLKLSNGAPGSNDLAGKLSTGSLKSSLNYLNSKGEFDDSPNAIRGIAYYTKSLDLLATSFADAFNKANNHLPAVPPATGHENDLFAPNDGTTGGITAANIGIAAGWSNGSYGITATKDGDTTSAKNGNILHMIGILSEKKEYTITTGTGNQSKIFTGTFQEFFTNIGTVLGSDVKSTTGTLKSTTAVASDLANQKDNMSAVSLDEEGMNILYYQKSFNAAARLMTALDETIQTIISGMGLVGR